MARTILLGSLCVARRVEIEREHQIYQSVVGMISPKTGYDFAYDRGN